MGGLHLLATCRAQTFLQPTREISVVKSIEKPKSLSWEDAFREMPLVAILRGVQPDEVVAVGKSLFQQGIRIIEVTLNSERPFDSIKRLSDAIGTECIVGAGTVTTVDEVDKVCEAGGKIVISPNTDPAVIRRTKQLGLISAPGFRTPSEAYQAVHSGADVIKLFPADAVSPVVLKAMTTILPKHARVLVVGGISSPDQMRPYLEAKAAGF